LLLAAAALIGYLACAAFAAALNLPPSQPGVYVYDLAHVWQPGTIQQAQLEIANIRAND